MNAAKRRKARAHERNAYLAMIERFALWCADRKLPFKWAKTLALKRFMEEWDGLHNQSSGTRPAGDGHG